MVDEKEFLEAIKSSGIGFPDVLKMLKKEGKIEDLKTAEEIEAEEIKGKELKALKKAQKKAKKEKEKEEPEAQSPPEEPEEKEIDLKKRLTDIEAKLEKLSKSGKIPGKTPSDGKKIDEDKLPDGVKPSTITTNKFEVRV